MTLRRLSLIELAIVAAPLLTKESASLPRSRLSVAMPEPAPRSSDVSCNRGVPIPSQRFSVDPPPTITERIEFGAVMPPLMISELPPVALRPLVPLSGDAIVSEPPLTDVVPV